jgi:YVTN family beta-propeller protein
MSILRKILLLSLMLFVTISSFSQITVIDTIEVGEQLMGVAVNPQTNRIYVAGLGSVNVYVIDGSRDSVVAAIETGYAAWEVCVNSQTNRIYLMHNYSLSVIDGVGDSVITTIDGLGYELEGVCVNPQTNRIYAMGFVGELSNSRVYVIDGSTNLVIDSIEVGEGSEGICVNPETNRIYDVDVEGNVYVIDGSVDSVIDIIEVEGNIREVCVNPQTNRIYVTGGNFDNIFVLDGESNAVIDTIDVGDSPVSINVNPQINRIYVANRFSDDVSVIDGSKDSVIATVGVGHTPLGVAVNPQMNRVYVSCHDDGTVWVLQDNGIRVTSPNGGEKWQSDSTYDITWTSYKTIGGIKIEYSLDNGLDWTEITASIPDTGSHPWTIPDTMSYNCLVRISDTNGTLSDISDAVFTIYSEPFIVVTSPNGGEIWPKDSTYDITWASAGIGSDVEIEYSINNGSNWMSIEDTIPDTESYHWIIPFAPSDSCLVKIASLDGSISDTSDSVFTIFSPPFITVTSPNGGEKWQSDSTYDITWTSYQTSGGVKIEYSLNNGLDWTEIIASIPDTDAYPWTIPDTLSFSCLIRVSDTNGSLSDTSDGVFTIFSVPIITVVSPNGGEELYEATDYDIIWLSAGTSGAVKIELNNNGIDWTEIIASITDTGAYLWAIPPNTSSSRCFVRVADTNGKIADISDEPFLIYGSGTPTPETPKVYSLNVSGIATSSQVEFTYTLPEKANDIKFTLYNILGVKIKEENLKESPAGFYSGKIKLSGVSKGIYFIKMEVNGGKFTQTKKFVLM